ncbi:MAG: efflux RND transporter periplasmic adaptor subunit [Gallionella sp.]|nr:efflux RND transporter periplasmic adaptor subunit [Gallionella sp.]
MNKTYKILLSTALLSAMAGSGYWYGKTSTEHLVPSADTKIENKILYYRNPMGLPDTSPVPKKDAMGMDYVAVYSGEEQATSSINISIDKVQKLGVKSEATTLRELNSTLRVTGRVEIDERRTYTIAPKFEGWVERLHVNTTGQLVTKGQVLFEAYSPELVSAQREQSLAAQGLAAMKDADEEARHSMQRLAEAGATRLKNWDVGNAKLSGNRISYHAKETGIVLEKKAGQGMRFMPGEVLYQIADLSTVWVIADVPEQEIGQLQLGSMAKIDIDAYPQHSFDGKIDFIYPTLNSATRTLQVRIHVANPKAMLKPAMFANAQLAVGKGNKVLAIPTSAVIDSGTRQVVLVRLAEGRFEPRNVTLGGRSNDYVEVLNGITEGEQVVTAANFLIDSESNLKAALGGMSEVPHPLPSQPPLLRGGAREESGRSAPLDTPLLRSTPSPVRGGAATPAAQKPVGHQAQGTLEAINDDGTVSITHDPIPALKWPAMTMDFALTNPSLAANIKLGSAISFEIVERGEGEWVVTKLKATQAETSHAEHNH